MNLLEQLRKLYGLGDTVSEIDVLAAVTAQKTAVDTHSASLKAIAAAAGVTTSAAAVLTADAIITDLQARQTGGDEVLATLRGTVVELQTRLTTLQAETARDKATAFIDKAIAEFKVGVVPLRDHYIDRHMKDAAGVEKEIAALPTLNGGRVVTPPASGSTGAGLSTDEIALCAQMGITQEQFAASKKQLGQEAL